jgi:flagellar basal body-associated protein FliL
MFIINVIIIIITIIVVVAVFAVITNILWHVDPLLGNDSVNKPATNTQQTIEDVQS